MLVDQLCLYQIAAQVSELIQVVFSLVVLIEASQFLRVPAALGRPGEVKSVKCTEHVSDVYLIYKVEVSLQVQAHV